MAKSKIESEITVKLDFSDIKKQLQNLLEAIEKIESENNQPASEH